MTRRIGEPDAAAPRVDYRTLVLLWVGAVVAAWILGLLESEAFAPYFGSLDPIVTVVLLAFTAAAALTRLERVGWFVIRSPDRSGRVHVFLLASVLVVPVIIVDVAGGFGEDVNVRLPDALLFYPAIALVAETVFHLLPLSVLSVLSRPLRRVASRDTILWGSVLLASLPEPVFQMAADPQSPLWATIYVGFHLLVFNIIALVLFKRFDFVTMYSFRFVYYVEWHIIWGVLRLPLLF